MNESIGWPGAVARKILPLRRTGSRGSGFLLPSAEPIWLAVIAAVLALLIAAWVYGIYCYVQMVRHRRTGIPASSLLWPPEYLTDRGREYRRRALWSYATFAVLAVFLVALNYLGGR